VALLGEVGSWQLRDTYENVVGKKPPRDWSWERTARELFGEFDRLRVAQVGKLYEEGQAARAAGNFEKMRAAFDQLLAYDPHFEQRAQLAAGYVAFASAAQDKSRDAAIAALRRAERLDPALKDAMSLRLTLEAEALEERGIADSTLLERAIEQNPANSRAQSALARFERGEPKRSESTRYVAAGSILAVALGAIAWLLLRKPKAEPLPASGAPDAVAPNSVPAAQEDAESTGTPAPR
jgi:tetratricopeptide (TPR) repeat protein